MVTVTDIKKEFEDKYKVVIHKKSKDIILSKNLKNKSNDLFKTINNPSINLYYLKYYLYNNELKDELFRLLEINDYNKNYEIKDLLNNIKSSSSFSNTKQIAEKYINSPYIDNLYLQEDSIKIQSKKLGNYQVLFADKYFLNNYDIYNYIKKEKLEYGCHRHTEFLVNENSNFYSITSICTNRFLNTNYYHSYCYDKRTNKVIDLCYNLVMNKSAYDRLFNTREIFKIKGKCLSEAYHIALLSDLSFSKMYSPIASTLFQQYIWENNLKTPNKKLYSEKPKLLIKMSR